jgi:hypothetical protein
MAKFVVGDRVIRMLSGDKGEVATGFRCLDSNGKPPRHDEVPVHWDNGTATYIYPNLLDYEAL